jgi:hypothetical protein
MKVEIKTVSFYILGYLLEVVIRLWLFGNQANLGHFSHEKSFVWVEIIFLRA